LHATHIGPYEFDITVSLPCIGKNILGFVGFCGFEKTKMSIIAVIPIDFFDVYVAAQQKVRFSYCSSPSILAWNIATKSGHQRA